MVRMIRTIDSLLFVLLLSSSALISVAGIVSLIRIAPTFLLVCLVTATVLLLTRCLISIASSRPATLAQKDKDREMSTMNRQKILPLPSWLSRRNKDRLS